MAIVVEDGTGIADAVSYLSVADADSHHAARGNIRWTDASVTDASKEAALVKATDFADKFFGKRFIGYRYTQEQALEWPRAEAVDRDGYERFMEVPRELKKAVAELAVRALIYDVLAPDVPGSAPRQSMQYGDSSEAATAGEVNSERVKLGPLEVEVGYRTGSEARSSGGSGSSDIPAWAQPVYSEAVAWMHSITCRGSKELLRA